jgi:hypothetical protein
MNTTSGCPDKVPPNEQKGKQTRYWSASARSERIGIVARPACALYGTEGCGVATDGGVTFDAHWT